MIHVKFDWLTFKIEQTCIKDVANCIGIEFSEYFKNNENTEISLLMEQRFKDQEFGCIKYKYIDINNVKFKIELADWENINPSVRFSFDVFTYPTVVTLDISGSGLDFLRSVNPKIDEDLFNEFLFGRIFADDMEIPKSHVTRCDIAFDFVNVHDDDFHECSRELAMLQLNRASLVPCKNSNAACSFSLNFGSDKSTIYLGRTTSARLLRIYDKMLERKVKGGKNDSEPYFCESELENDPEFTLNSWWRVEYQLRAKNAQAALYGCGGDFQRIARDICNRYQLCYPNLEGYRKGDHMKPIQCFHNIFDYEGLIQIGLNNHFCTVEYVPTVVEKVESFENRFRNKLFLAFCHYGDLKKVINEQLHLDYEAPYASPGHRRYVSLKRDLCSYAFNLGLFDITDIHEIYYDSSGCLQLREDRSLTDSEIKASLELWRIDAAENKVKILDKSLRWYQDLFDAYIMKCGGLTWNKNMLESIEEVTERLGFDPRRETYEIN